MMSEHPNGAIAMQHLGPIARIERLLDRVGVGDG
jgi:hypothetical protein